MPDCLLQAEPAQYLGPHGVHRVMENKDGLHLQSYFWPAADAKAVVLFVHGHGAHLMFEILKQTVRPAGSAAFCGGGALSRRYAVLSILQLQAA